MKCVYSAKKGFVLSYTLVYFSIISSLYLIVISHLQLTMTWLQAHQYRSEKLILEANIINRIVYEYTEYLEENFSEVWEENEVRVEYDDMLASISVKGKYNIKAELIFDDICVCILEYNYLNDE